MRIGFGFDSHRLTAGRPFYLGGVFIDSPTGPEAHLDGDVLIHVLIDALFGALALGDIGSHYPPSDAKYKDANSRDLLEECITLVRNESFSPVNVDCTVILERPKIQPYVAQMRTVLAEILGIQISCVSIKAKTAEKLGAVGEGKAVEAQAAVLLSSVGTHDDEMWV